MLTKATDTLDPSSPDGVCGRSHLTAIQSGAKCGCSEETTQQAIVFAIHDYVMKNAPKGLVEDVTIDDGGWVTKTTRKPTPEEVIELQRIVDHAIAHWRQSVDQGMPSVYHQLRGE